MDKEKVIKGLKICCIPPAKCEDCPYNDLPGEYCNDALCLDALSLLKKQGIPEELKQQMWNALYAEEDKLEKKYVGTKDHDNWFNTYRPWLQDGFNLAIKAIADWEEGR